MSIELSDRDTVTVSNKGQITIPKHLREQFDLVPGTRLQFVKLPDGHLELVPKTGRVEELFGILHDPQSEALSLEDIDNAIAHGAAHTGSAGLHPAPVPDRE